MVKKVRANFVKGADLYKFDYKLETVLDEAEIKFRYSFKNNSKYSFERFCRMHLSRNSIYNMYS